MAFDIRQLVEQADLPADQKQCIGDRLERAGITSYEALQNAPRLAGHPVCGTDVYSLVAALNEAYESNVPGHELDALLDEETVGKLVAGGFHNAETVTYATDDQLRAVDGIGRVTFEKIRKAFPAAAATEGEIDVSD
jgi:hypothetical protein